MRRYQIYLADEHRLLLRRLAVARGCSMSNLVREAIEATFQKTPRGAAARQILDQTFGAWGGRASSSQAYVEKLRNGRRWNRRLRATRREVAKPGR